MDGVAAEADALGVRLRDGVKALPDPKPLDVFDRVYAEMTPELESQKAEYAAYLSTFEGAH